MEPFPADEACDSSDRVNELEHSNSPSAAYPELHSGLLETIGRVYKSPPDRFIQIGGEDPEPGFGI